MDKVPSFDVASRRSTSSLDGSLNMRAILLLVLFTAACFHGGVISYAADNALTYAGGSVLGPSVVTSEFKINYVRPAMGEFIVARGTVVHAGKNQAVCRCDVYVFNSGSERLCATAQGTITRFTQPSESRV